MIKDRFFDRQIYLDTLSKRIYDLKDGYRQNIAIIGDELVGKTSIIFKFLHNFYDTRIIVLYLEMRPQTLAFFARRFVGILLYNFLSNSGIPLKEDLDYLIAKSEGYIPRTVEKINSILLAVGKRRKSNIFTELLGLCELMHQETGKHCVVIMDEFQNVESLGIANIYREWSKLLISQKKTMYIIVSSMKYKTRTILSKDLSLLFGNFEVVTVEPFDIKTSEEYLLRRLGGAGFNAGLQNFIVHFTGGYPLYLEVITEELLKAHHGGLADILENILFDASGALHQRFSTCMKRFLDLPSSNDYVSILYLVASGRNKIKDIAHLVNKPVKQLTLRINRLMELDTITRSGDFLKINDRVFGFWLKFVYQEKTQSLSFDARSQKTKFRDNIEEMIQEYLVSAEKSIPERVTELLRLFEDDTMQFEKRKLRLDHFREIKPLELNIGNLRHGLIGRSNDSVWIVAFKSEPLTEEEISAFSRECRKFRHKLQRKIIITLKDPDTNARLKAMEEKVWTWDINNLNQFLDLYSKPRVIA
jgi:GTPase SAR1 family protein